MHDEKLIELVRKNEPLYDLAHPKYMDPRFKTTIWNEIGRELKTNGSQCKTRWINIRDHFRRHIGKRVTKNPLGIRMKKYKYEPLLKFLLPHLVEKKTRTSIVVLDEKDPNASQDEAPVNVEEHEEVEDDDESHEEITQQPAAYNTRSRSPRKEQEISALPHYRNTTQKNVFAMESPSSMLLNYIIEKNNATNTNTQHPIDAFVTYIAATVKTFTPYYQHVAKGRIFQVVHDLELDQLKNEQYSIRTSSNVSEAPSTSLSSSPEPSFHNTNSNLPSFLGTIE